MGSGCVSNSSNGFGKVFQTISDTSVKYTGPAIPALGICTGDTLAEVDAVILQQIIDFSTAVGISVPSIDLTQCDCFKASIGCCGRNSCLSLTCILQAYLDCMCQLYTDVEILKVKVTAMFDGPYNVGCLTATNPAITSSSKLPDILQEVIVELCTAESDITNIKTQITNLITNLPNTIGNFLNSAIGSCGTGSDSVVKTGTGSSFHLSILGNAPIGAIMMYSNGNPSWFDSSGKGFANSPACGWAYANGQNGTVDMRNQLPIGATNMGGSGGLKANAGTHFYNPGDIAGADSVLLTAATAGVGAHTHPVVDPGHSHILAFGGDTFSGSKFNNMVKFDGNNLFTTPDPLPDIGNIHIKILKAYTSISIGSSTGAAASSAHDNRPPITAVIFIQRIS